MITTPGSWLLILGGHALRTDGAATRQYVHVTQDSSHGRIAVYDRQLLLFGVKRDAVLELWEVQRYGTDSYGDADHVSVYGMRPAEWYERGIRLLGRTAVECTRDALADLIAGDVAAVAGSAPSTSDALVVDPFIGSGNTLYWIARRLHGGVRGQGFELDAVVFQLTKRNLSIVESSVEVANADYAAGLAGVNVPSDRLVIVFIAPPWGTALDPRSGLDLLRTNPPIAEIVDELVQRFPYNPLLVAIQVHESVDPSSLAELERRFDWSALRLYELDDVGQNHGVLLLTQGWAPT